MPPKSKKEQEEEAQRMLEEQKKEEEARIALEKQKYAAETISTGLRLPHLKSNIHQSLLTNHRLPHK